MNPSAIALMIISIATVWGGLGWFVWSLRYRAQPPLSPEAEAEITRLEEDVNQRD